MLSTIRQQLEIDDVRLRDESSETWGANACFSWLYPCSELQRYRLRISVWSSFVEGSLHCLGFEDLTLRVAPAEPRALYTAGVTQVGLEAPVVLYQDSSGLDSWNAYRSLLPVTSWTPGDWSDRIPANVSFRGYRASEGARVVGAGDRMPGWLQVTSEAGGIALAVADGWKHFPLALRGEPRAVEAALFPREFAAAFGLRPGERKTPGLALVFGGAGDCTEAAQAQAWIERPIRFAFDTGQAVATRAVPGLSRAGLEPDYDLWNHPLPVWVALVTADGDTVGGLALYADVWGEPPIWGLLRFAVQDLARLPSP